MVYFVACCGAIKIGYSDSPAKRIASIQTDAPDKLEIIAVTEGTYEDEGRLHRQFWKYRRHGEWFDDVVEIRVAAQRRAQCDWRLLRDLKYASPRRRRLHPERSFVRSGLGVAHTLAAPRLLEASLHRKLSTAERNDVMKYLVATGQILDATNYQLSKLFQVDETIIRRAKLRLMPDAYVEKRTKTASKPPRTLAA